MTPPSPGIPNSSSSMTGRFPSPMVELRKRAISRLAEKVDPTKSRGKPVSLLRQEGKRTLEQFFDLEAPALQKADRDRIIDELLADVIGYGPLEELFRDADVKEILVLSSNVVIVRKNDNWLPSPVRFRDTAHMRAVIQKMSDAGDPLVASPASTAGFDAKLANGFRAMVILPPDIMEQQPIGLFVRGAGSGSGLAPAITTPPPVAARAPSTSGLIATPAPRASGSTSGPRSGVGVGPTPAAGSGVAARTPATGSAGGGFAGQGAHGSAGGGFAGQGHASAGGGFAKPASAVVPAVAPPAPAAPPPPAGGPDPLVRVRQKVTERIIMKLAGAGVYDLNVIPLPELRKIAMAYVIEFVDAEKIPVDEITVSRLANEILAGMNR